MLDSLISERLRSLPTLNKTSLIKLWRQVFEREPPPEIRKDLMSRLIAHRLQEQTFGGLSNSASRRLRQLASAFESDPRAAVFSQPRLKPGTRLVRRWRGAVYVVEADTEGYLYRGTRYENLSEIARLITGTRWSGPLFFGLRPKQSVSHKANE